MNYEAAWQQLKAHVKAIYNPSAILQITQWMDEIEDECYRCDGDYEDRWEIAKTNTAFVKEWQQTILTWMEAIEREQ